MSKTFTEMLEDYMNLEKILKDFTIQKEEE